MIVSNLKVSQKSWCAQYFNSYSEVNIIVCTAHFMSTWCDIFIAFMLLKTPEEELEIKCLKFSVMQNLKSP